MTPSEYEFLRATTQDACRYRALRDLFAMSIAGVVIDRRQIEPQTGEALDAAIDKLRGPEGENRAP